MDAIELDVQRMNTQMFIDADPITISLVRTESVRTASGGQTVEKPLQQPAPQTFRLLPQNDRNVEVQGPDGRMVNPSFVLLGVWDADMKRGDTFVLNNVEFQIAGPIRPEHSLDSVYERKGDVVRRG